MLKGLGLRPSPVGRPALILSDEERSAGERLWRSLRSPRIVIHPGGVSARRWRSEHYRDLSLELARAGYGVVLTGSASERLEFGRVLPDGALPVEISNLMGRLSVRELMGLIARADAVVSGATGPAHLAAALDTPTVSLFDPRKNNLPVRWKPLGGGFLLRPDVPTCDSCIGESCPYWDCLDRLTVRYVVDSIAQAVKRPTSLTVLHL
jgi:heptosyltransferase-2